MPTSTPHPSARTGFQLGPILVACAVALVVLALGGAATRIGPWFYDLVKPSWQPPNWLFAPVWTTIYALVALAAIHAWPRMPGRAARRRMLLLFAVNIVLNVLWSVLFFTLRRPDWSLPELVPFWLSILALVVNLWPRSTLAGMALLPYLLWVLYAASLNVEIVRLNPSFGS